jgi:hypothetical protein
MILLKRAYNGLETEFKASQRDLKAGKGASQVELDELKVCHLLVVFLVVSPMTDEAT